jgi:hypothetical protein
LIVFLDASAWVKRYAAEPGSSEVKDLSVRSPLALSRITEVEVASALARLTRQGILSAGQRDAEIQRLQLDLETISIVEFTAELSKQAQALVQRHPLRASDAVQLASALALRQQTSSAPLFVCYDQRLSEAARAEGFETFGA